MTNARKTPDTGGAGLIEKDLTDTQNGIRAGLKKDNEKAFAELPSTGRWVMFRTRSITEVLPLVGVGSTSDSNDDCSTIEVISYG